VTRGRFQGSIAAVETVENIWAEIGNYNWGLDYTGSLAIVEEPVNMELVGNMVTSDQSHWGSVERIAAGFGIFGYSAVDIGHCSEMMRLAAGSWFRKRFLDRLVHLYLAVG